ncbi:alpha/beta hydrolase family protein [Siphonobacter sp. SORGH_AS_1065]|uniref:alpha/beta hydrolase n=1 Tax=Siphonobacter sp. SORGH_AS_1065 TaxID=3041795 RepID=UPI002781CDFB|nr:alpha/beta hydrolase family protein [Siphonobacter sp. SORGH_AS_1065]MDQ1086622.1 S-formylglutathione hydrolase FrmB [Siphonobacter sp. SORGH_AS_1065]
MKIVIILFLLISSPAVFGQKGHLQESLPLKSSILGKVVNYSILLPEGYETTNRRYPVLYLLHGLGDDETGWTQMGEVERIVEETKAVPMIIVMPNAEKTWYMNSADGKIRYEDFFIKELIPYIDSTYRSRPQKNYRAIAGLSMGGYGTLLLATKHPEYFAAAAPLSAAVFTDEEIVTMKPEDYQRRFGKVMPTELKGKNRLSDHWQQFSIFNLVQKQPVESLKSVRYYIDCGDDDHLIRANMALHTTLLDKTIPHEFRVHDGGHTWTYWREALPKVLGFVSQSFH